MSVYADQLKASITKYCAKIGTDPLLVQGAGGNVSWKDKDTLWVKVSGTWLADAMEKDIFVPVDLQHLRLALGSGNFAVTPMVLGESALKPSIETLLHALMAHRVVVHLHAIEALAYLVRSDWQTDFQSRLDASIRWTSVGYKKPGADLAEAVSLALQGASGANVIFLQNHGVVVGEEDIAEVEQVLNDMTVALNTPPIYHPDKLSSLVPVSYEGKALYYPITDSDIHQLATKIDLFNRLESGWALYPDHVVFLGAHPHTYNDMEALDRALCNIDETPQLIFIKGVGAFTKQDFSSAKNAQLRCYYDVLVRQNQEHVIQTLTPQQIGELLNWDAEQYRMGLAK